MVSTITHSIYCFCGMIIKRPANLAFPDTHLFSLNPFSSLYGIIIVYFISKFKPTVLSLKIGYNTQQIIGWYVTYQNISPILIDDLCCSILLVLPSILYTCSVFLVNRTTISPISLLFLVTITKLLTGRAKFKLLGVCY